MCSWFGAPPAQYVPFMIPVPHKEKKDKGPKIEYQALPQIGYMPTAMQITYGPSSACQVQAVPMVATEKGPKPAKVEPGKFWVQELDKAWVLRSMDKINKGCQPGHWEFGASGYPYFVREKKD